MKKFFKTTIIVGSMMVLLAGCTGAPADKNPVESGTTNSEYVGDPAPAPEMNFVQTEEEKAVYDQYTQDVQNQGEGDATDAPAFKH